MCLQSSAKCNTIGSTPRMYILGMNWSPVLQQAPEGQLVWFVGNTISVSSLPSSNFLPHCILQERALSDKSSKSYEYRITRSLYVWDTPWEISQCPSHILPLCPPELAVGIVCFCPSIFGLYFHDSSFSSLVLWCSLHLPALFTYHNWVWSFPNVASYFGGLTCGLRIFFASLLPILHLFFLALCYAVCMLYHCGYSLLFVDILLFFWSCYLSLLAHLSSIMYDICLSLALCYITWTTISRRHTVSANIEVC